MSIILGQIVLLTSLVLCLLKVGYTVQPLIQNEDAYHKYTYTWPVCGYPTGFV